MFNIWVVASNASWLFGLALILAALSWGHWAAGRSQTRLPDVSAHRVLRRVVGLSLLLFCAGMAATSDRRWERVLWGVLTLAWAVQVTLSPRTNRRRAREQ
jgi:hypothetical protein